MKGVVKLKVGFVGAGGTGKSSVANILAADKTVPEDFKSSVVRDVFKQLGYTGEVDQFKMNDVDILHLQKKLLEAKYELDKNTKHGIFDRTPVDHLAYALYRCGNTLNDADLDWMRTQCWQFTNKYDLLFFFPVYDWDVKDDGFRQNNKAYRIATQTLMLGLLAEYNVTYYTMKDESIEDRAKFIKEKMDELRTR